MKWPIPDPTNYDVSLETGFLPEEPPPKRLPAYYEPWEEVADDLPALILTKQIRKRITALPNLDASRLSGKAEIRRAYSILGFLAHAYVWCRPTPVSNLPSNICDPWIETSSKLGLPPVCTYASVCLWNWRTLSAESPREWDLEHLATQHTYTGSIDESWFYLISVELEKKGGPCIAHGLDALKAIREGNDEKLEEFLQLLAEDIDSMSALLSRMTELCDPHAFYNRLRPFLAGWQNMEASGLPSAGVIYGSETSPRKYCGGSNAQSSLIQVLDIFLSVHHRPLGERTPPSLFSKREGHESPPSTAANNFLIEMRQYMPREHREFLQSLERVANIRDYVLSSGSSRLMTAYDACLACLRGFRTRHIQIVTRYITIPARESSKSDGSVGLARSSGEVGTGGTTLLPFLRQVRDETGDAAAGDWGSRLLTVTEKPLVPHKK